MRLSLFFSVLVLTLGETLYKVEQMRTDRRGEIELWNNRQSIDSSVSRVRAGLHQIVMDDDLRDSFYVDHYKRDLEFLDSRIQNTVNTKEMFIDRNHIDSTEILLALYDSKLHSVFRATHCLSDVTDEFDVTFKIYFYAWLRRLESKKVRASASFCLRRSSSV